MIEQSASYMALNSSNRAMKGVILFSSILLYLAAAFLSPNTGYAEETLQKSTKTVEQKTSEHKTAVEKSLEETKQNLIGRDVPNLEDAASKSFKGVLYCLALALLGLSLYRRFFHKGQNTFQGEIEIIARQSLGSKTALLVVRTEGQKFLLAQSQDDVTLISEIEQPMPFDCAFTTIAESTNQSPEQKTAAAGRV